MRKFGRWLLAIVAGVVGLILVAVAGLMVALSLGPITLDPLTPWLLQRIASATDELSVAFKAPELAWAADRRGVVLRVHELHVRARSAAPEVRAAEAEVEVELGATLLERQLVLDEIGLTGVDLQITRDASGGLGVASGGQGWESSSTAGAASSLGPVAGALVDLLASPTRGSGPRIGSLDIDALTVIYADPARSLRLVGNDGAIRLDRRRGTAALTAQLELLGGRLTAELGIVTADRLAWRATMTGFDPAAVASLAGGSLPQGEPVPVTATVRGTLERNGALGPAPFEVKLTGPELVLPGVLAGPVALDALRIVGTIEPSAGRLVVDQMQLQRGPGHVTGKAEAVLADGAVRLQIEATGGGLDAATIKALWPVIAAPRARAWVAERLLSGRADGAVFKFMMDERATPPVDTRLTFGLTDGSARFMNELPPVEAVAGQAELTEAGFELKANHATLGGLSGETVDVRITFTDPSRADRLDVDARLGGPAAAALGLVAALPFGRDLPLRPDQLRGTGTYHLVLGLPLLEDVPAADVRVMLNAALRGAALDRVVPGLTISDGALQLRVDDTALTVAGELRLNGMPVRLLEARQTLTGGAKAPATLRLAAEPDRVDLSIAGVPIAFLPEGKLGLAAEIELPHQGRPVIRLNGDAAPARIDLPSLGYHKPIGSPGTFKLDLRPGEGTIEIASVAVNLPGLELAGKAQVTTDGQLDHLHLQEFVLHDTRLAGEVAREASGRYRARVDAKRLDLRPLLRGQLAGPGGQGTLPPFGLEVAAGLVELPGGTLRDLDLSVDHAAIVQEVNGTATLDSRQAVRLRLAPPGDQGQQSFTLSTDDAGTLLELINEQARNAAGGALRLRGTLEGQDPWRASGRVVMRDFHIEQAPTLARILSLASFTGIQNALEGRGIHITRARTDFTLADEAITLRNGRANGSEIGLTVDGTMTLDSRFFGLSGTVVPFYTLNHLLGRIPGIGNLLAGAGGIGAFAATYSVTGPFDEPQVSVNPLSAIVPGFIRDIFNGLPPAEESELATNPGG